MTIFFVVAWYSDKKAQKRSIRAESGRNCCCLLAPQESNMSIVFADQESKRLTASSEIRSHNNQQMLKQSQPSQHCCAHPGRILPFSSLHGLRGLRFAKFLSESTTSSRCASKTGQSASASTILTVTSIVAPRGKSMDGHRLSTSHLYTSDTVFREGRGVLPVRERQRQLREIRHACLDKRWHPTITVTRSRCTRAWSLAGTISLPHSRN